MRSRRDRAMAGLAGIALAGSLLAACAGSSGGGPNPAAPSGGGRSKAYARLIDMLEHFEVSGGVRTDGGGSSLHGSPVPWQSAHGFGPSV